MCKMYTKKIQPPLVMEVQHRTLEKEAASIILNSILHYWKNDRWGLRELVRD